MKKLILLIIFMAALSSHTTCFGQSNPQLEMRQAEAFFESKQYSQARQIYQGLLQQSTDSWQRAVLIYNLGCVYLAEGNWDEAIRTLQSVPLNNELAPLLQYRIRHNLSIAFLKRAKSLEDQHAAQAEESAKAALSETNTIPSAYCILEKVEGKKECDIPPDAETFKQILRQQMSEIKKKQETQRISQAKLPEGLTLLMQGAKEALTYLQSLDEKTIEANLKMRYLNLFSEELTDYESLWNILEKQVHEDASNPATTEWLKLYKSAHKLFQEGISNMKHGLIDQSTTSFQNSLKILEELIAKPPPPSTPPPSNQPEQQNAPTEERQPEDHSMDQLLQQLLKMEQDDNLIVPKEPTSQKKVEKPW